MRDQTTSNREAELTAITAVGSGDLLGADVIILGFQYLHLYRGDFIMAERCLWLLLGRHDLADATNQTELAQYLRVGKATINKCCRYFQERMPELSPMPNTRTEAARKNMRRARINQLAPNEKS